MCDGPPRARPADRVCAAGECTILRTPLNSASHVRETLTEGRLTGPRQGTGVPSIVLSTETGGERHGRGLLNVGSMEAGKRCTRPATRGPSGDPTRACRPLSSRQLQLLSLERWSSERRWPDHLPDIDVDATRSASAPPTSAERAHIYRAKKPIAGALPVRRQEVEISSANNGRGSRSNHQGAFFAKVYRGWPANPTSPGTGLGLAMCITIVRAHDGRIHRRRVSSATGASFHLFRRL